MKKQIINRITALLLLATILIPVSIQFLHSFQEHDFRVTASDEYDLVQHTQKSCAVFHHQINFNAIDLSFHFEIKPPQIIVSYNLILKTKISRIFSGHRSSRAPPVSFV